MVLITQMSPYILLGFMLAGIMHAFIPNRLYRKHLGGRNFSSVVKATLLGIPIPLCSCGVIPTAMSLHKEGASKGSTVSFLIATPQTGVDSIAATYSLMGLPFALLRPIAALVTALAGGAMVNRLCDGKSECNGDTDCTEGCRCTNEDAPTGMAAKCRLALRHAFVEMMQDIGKWLVIGLVIAGLITSFVPASFFAHFSDRPLLGMVLVLVCSVPMYLCATGSIPIAVALMLKGLSPGAALVMLMAGPAVNMASVMVIGKVMGKRAMAMYLTAIIAGAMAFGLATDYLLPHEWFTAPLTAMTECSHEGVPIFNAVCSVVLMLLLANAYIMKLRKNNTKVMENNNELTLRIKGMSCNHCKASVERTISKVAGVEAVTVELERGTASIKGSADPAKIKRAIEEIGFEVE